MIVDNLPAAAKSCPHRLRNIISMRDFSREEIDNILQHIRHVKANPSTDALRGKILAVCFFSPSTRTRLSFEAAMKRGGGATIGFAEGATTSSSKRETLHDTMKVIGQYADALVLRHPRDGAARLAADAAGKPVINAGDGSNQHPTQTLVDLYTIHESQGGLEGLHIAFTGDLKNARTIHSLVQACAMYKMRIYFVPQEGLGLPTQLLDELKRQGILFSIHESLHAILPKLDILYMTRIQEEFLPSAIGYAPKSGYELNLSMLAAAKPSLRIMHPLPRVREIDPEIDHSPYAYYFHQSQNGLYVREALLHLILKGAE